MHTAGRTVITPRVAHIVRLRQSSQVQCNATDGLTSLFYG